MQLPNDLFNTPDPRAVQAQVCWATAITLLTSSGMPERQARPYFGKLLARNHLHPSELLEAVRAAESLGTGDPASYLNKAAQRLSSARVDGAQACTWG